MMNIPSNVIQRVAKISRARLCCRGIDNIPLSTLEGRIRAWGRQFNVASIVRFEGRSSQTSGGAKIWGDYLSARTAEAVGIPEHALFEDVILAEGVRRFFHLEAFLEQKLVTEALARRV